MFAVLPYFSYYLLKIGPLFIFFALALGIVGLPIPDELLLITSGYLMAHKKLSVPLTILAAYGGSMVGITTSYFLGRLVSWFFLKKYAKKLNITEEKVELAKSGFKRIGKWMLIVGYFIPILRHLIGLLAGGAKMSYKDFAIYAYSGSILWCSTFLAIGYFLEYLKVRYMH